MTTQDDVDKLNEALNRLMVENANLRQKNEEAQVLIARRAPNADGLPLVSALKTILDDRDAASDRIQYFRNELKKVLKLLLADNDQEAKKELNQFLFDNPK